MRSLPDLPAPPPMTACTCLSLSFAEVAARLDREGRPSGDAERVTGCGSICTACLPDLQRYLAARTAPRTTEGAHPR
ncbi:MAG: hypothetical protein IPL89_03430 [Acidobacteria bacterium]|nr:hypothetical protein [Acidobacteriota bacterium]